jgi:tRNA(His) 5'-end guanylyltransferase
MLAQSLFSHKQLQGLSCDQMKSKMLIEKGINWNNLSSTNKQGSFFRKEKIEVQLEKEKLEKIYVDKKPYNGRVIRGKIIEINMPIFQNLANPIKVIFNGSQLC